jgi:hypothetical protein
MTKRLVNFDVVGTLVDSQADILAAASAAYASENLAPPSRSEILSIVGLSRSQAFARLMPDSDPALQTLQDTGLPSDQVVMIGETTNYIDMGRAAGVCTICVGWGYRPTESLQAERIVRSFAELPATIDHLLDRAE